MKEFEHRTALLGARGDGRPDAFAPLSARRASRALGDFAVDDDKANRLFGEVIRRINSRRRDEFEVGLSVLAKALSDVLSFEARRWAFADLQDLGSRFLQPKLELLRCHALSAVDYAEQGSDLLEKAFREVLRNRVQLEEKLDVTN